MWLVRLKSLASMIKKPGGISALSLGHFKMIAKVNNKL